MIEIITAGLDLETTGLNQTDGHRIIECYVGLYKGKKKFDQLNLRIHPGRGIDPKAQEVHGISLEMLTGCPSWEETAGQVNAFLSQADVIVAHNGEGFDLPFLIGEMVRVGQPMIMKPLVDTMLQGRWATPDGSLPNLRALAFACGVEYDVTKAHAADYDVNVMMDCYNSVVDRGFFQVPVTPYMFKPMLSEEKKKAARAKK